MITRRAFVGLAAVGAMGLMGAGLGGCAQAPETSTDETPEGGFANAPTQDAAPVSQPTPMAAYEGALGPGMVCVTEYATNTVAVVDTAAAEVRGRLSVGRNPVSAVTCGDMLFVGCTGAGEVTAVPLAAPTASQAVPVGRQILGLCPDEERGVLYAGDYFSNNLYVVDVALLSLVGTIEVHDEGYKGRTDPPPCCTIEPGAGRRIVSVALSPVGDVLYCANYGTYDVACVDVAARAEVEAFDGVVGPRQILVSPDGAHLILAGVGGEGEQQVSDLLILDRASGRRVREVPVGLSVAGGTLAPDGAAAWAISRDDGQLVAFETADWTETGRMDVGVGTDSLALSADGAMAYVANSVGGLLRIVDLATMTVTATVEGLASPKGIAVIA